MLSTPSRPSRGRSWSGWDRRCSRRSGAGVLGVVEWRTPPVPRLTACAAAFGRGVLRVRHAADVDNRDRQARLAVDEQRAINAADGRDAVREPAGGAVRHLAAVGRADNEDGIRVDGIRCRQPLDERLDEGDIVDTGVSGTGVEAYPAGPEKGDPSCPAGRRRLRRVPSPPNRSHMTRRCASSACPVQDQ